MEPGVVLAFAAGVLSFTSPCCLPLLPGYLGFVSGLSPTDAAETDRGRTLLGASLFVLGFAIVFTALGASASILGRFLIENRTWLLKISGAFLLLVGITILLKGGFPFLAREIRADLGRMKRGPLGAVPLGMAFALGWTPCVGPVLAGLLTYAGGSGSLAKGAGLLLVYSLGLGLPFIASAMFYGKAAMSFKWLRKHGGAISRGGGVVLAAMGLLLFTGGWTTLFAPILRWYAKLGWPPI